MLQYKGLCRLVDQLRCALKAKNAIIEQLEEEKRDAMSEASRQFQMQITELNDKLRALETAATHVSSLHFVLWTLSITKQTLYL